MNTEICYSYDTEPSYKLNNEMNLYEFQCGYDIDRSLKIYNSAKNFQKIKIDKNKPDSNLFICFLNTQTNTSNIDIDTFIRVGELNCPFDCSDNGNCISGVCNCKNFKIGPGCSLDSTELLPEIETKLELIEDIYKFLKFNSNDCKFYFMKFQNFRLLNLSSEEILIEQIFKSTVRIKKISY